MTLKRDWSTFVCALAVVGFGYSSLAAPIVGSMHEPFSDYPAPTTFVNPPVGSSQNGGVGWNVAGISALPNDAGATWGLPNTNGGANRTVNAPGLTYSATGYLAPTGNKLTLDAVTANAVNQIGRTLGGQTVDTGSMFFSLLMSRNNDTNRTFNVAFFGPTSPTAITERFAVGQIGAAAGGTPGNIGLLMNNSNPGGLVNSASPIAMGTGITHLLVGRIDWNAAGFETVSLWVDPTDVTNQAAAGAVYASTSAFELTSLSVVRPFAGNTVTTTTPPLQAVSGNVDEIRVGGTWESVTSLPVLIPEPGTTLLLGAGLMCLARFHRRQRTAD